MKKLVTYIFAILISNFAYADDEISGHYFKDYQLAGRDQTFSAEIKILRLSASKAAVIVSITAPTAGSSCGGGIKGIASVKKNVLTLVDTYEDDKCTMTIEVKNKHASVVDAIGCSGWSGAGCSIQESAVDVPWWGHAKASFKRDALKRVN